MSYHITSYALTLHAVDSARPSTKRRQCSHPSDRKSKKRLRGWSSSWYVPSSSPSTRSPAQRLSIAAHIFDPYTPHPHQMLQNRQHGYKTVVSKTGKANLLERERDFTAPADSRASSAHLCTWRAVPEPTLFSINRSPLKPSSIFLPILPTHPKLLHPISQKLTPRPRNKTKAPATRARPRTSRRRRKRWRWR